MGTKPRSTEERFLAGLARRAEELGRSSQSETRAIPKEPKGTVNEQRIQRAIASMQGPGRGTLPD